MLPIGKLSAATGVKVPTIRYYEQIGLMPEPGRSLANQRLYDRAAQERLAFIRHARELGFPLEAIRELLSLSDDPSKPCDAADRIARRQLQEVKARIQRLKALQSELEHMVEQCAKGQISNCRVIETLGNHQLCAHEHGAVATDADEENSPDRRPVFAGSKAQI